MAFLSNKSGPSLSKPINYPDLVQSHGGKKSWARIVSGDKKTTTKRKLQFHPQQIGSSVVRLSEEEWNNGIKQWENTLVGYTMGLNPPLFGIRRFAEAQWRRKGFTSAHKINEGVFLFKFNSYDEMMEVLDSGPWHYFEIPLMLQIWNPKLEIDRTKVKELPLWIRFPNLPIHFWSDDILAKMASSVGNPVCIEEVTDEAGDISQIRICAQVSASHSLVECISMETPDGEVFKQNVLYEWIPPKCSLCCNFGHVDINCAKKAVNDLNAKGKEIRDVVKQNVPNRLPVDPDIEKDKESIPINGLEICMPEKDDSGCSKACTSEMLGATLPSPIEICKENEVVKISDTVTPLFQSSQISLNNFFKDLSDDNESEPQNQEDRAKSKKNRRDKNKGKTPSSSSIT